MNLFDAHNHVHDERLAPQRAAVIERAARAGVTRMVCCGSSQADWPAVRALAAGCRTIVPSFGLHPWYVARRATGWFESLREALDAVPSAVGEIGLDHAIEDRDDAAMEDVFLRQLELSRERRLPVTLHCRRAWGRLLELLAPPGPHPVGMLIHSYSGSEELLPVLAGLNVFFSFSGSITFPGHRRRHRALRAVPADRLLLETDAPDILPRIPGAPKADPVPPNEPANLVYVAEAAAALLGRRAEDVAAETTQNAERLFLTRWERR